MDVVTGATGHIGNTLVRTLLAAGHKVRGLVLPRDDTSSLLGLDIDLRVGDVRRTDTLELAFGGADTVYHLASIISLGPGQRKMVYDVNVGGAANVADACVTAGVRRLVHTSSIHALVEPPKGETIDETCVFDPDRIKFDYGKTKAMGTLEVLKRVTGHGLDAVIVCPSGVIGPYDFGPSEMGRLLVAFGRRKLRAYLDGGYDFVDVRDVAAGMLAAAEKGRTGETYLLSGEQITVKDILSETARVAGLKPPRFKVASWMADLAAPFSVLWGLITRTKPFFTRDSLYYVRSNSVSSHTKATRELGYSPRPIRESIADTVRWLRQSGPLRPVRRLAEG